MQFPGKKKGCTKVEDPFFGKRKPSALLNRIHRKMKLLESKKIYDHRQLNCRFSCKVRPSNLETKTHGNSSLHELENQRQKHCSKDDSKNSKIAQRDEIPIATAELSNTSTLTDKWPTKEDFFRVLFRLM